jgi:thiamine biosynthesis lipoprotein
MTDSTYSITATESGLQGHYIAMASNCTVLIETTDYSLANVVLAEAIKETQRIEHKYSRYRKDNIVHKINEGLGGEIKVDGETARLLDFSERLFELSNGVFDITSGVFRKLWKFDGGSKIPPRSEAKKLMAQVGWQKVRWSNPSLTLLPGMQIDLGGIGKEYAVDSVAQKIAAITTAPVLINFGGDIFATSPPSKRSWTVGVNVHDKSKKVHIQLKSGGLATSGDANRYVENNGKRYSHILNAKTGWPVSNAPHTVTVAAKTCIEAGMLATLTLTKGKYAEQFATDEHIVHWIER